MGRPTSLPSSRGGVLALSGGVGGAKLVLGLARVLAPEDLTVVVNTGDDFEHFGLAISPDLDTLLYTLAGLADAQQGWGRSGETWHFMAALRRLGGPDWFALGDADLALHAERSRRLAEGTPLSEVTAAFARRLGVASTLLPMSDDRVRTRVFTDSGWLDFQHYFVRDRCAPVLRALAFEGAERARATPALTGLAQDTQRRAVLLCPSNPWLSLGPLLALPGVRAALAGSGAPVVAVSPLVAGRAVKGPTAKLMAELGLPVNHASIARYLAGLVDALVVDAPEPGLGAVADEAEMEIVVAPTLMTTLAERERLARTVLDVADHLRATALPRCRRDARTRP